MAPYHPIRKSALLRLPLALARRRAPCQRRAVGCRGRRGRVQRGGRGEGAAGGRVGAVEEDLEMEEINWMMRIPWYIVIGALVCAYWQKSNKDVHSEIMYILIQAYWIVYIHRIYPAWAERAAGVWWQVGWLVELRDTFWLRRIPLLT